jgi:hypothetical protein
VMAGHLVPIISIKTLRLTALINGSNVIARSRIRI